MAVRHLLFTTASYQLAPTQVEIRTAGVYFLSSPTIATIARVLYSKFEQTATTSPIQFLLEDAESAEIKRDSFLKTPIMPKSNRLAKWFLRFCSWWFEHLNR
ncbi:uncharacterized protein LOC130998213 [Salvia miltiorrhiza]|uniref:uncharacterized protein LOC130998213 n=1 Tax=Salvia miltiorrhiza TaxID=226208 RepID=UPI0025ACFA9D|nr:uncharacterized protein LOC130998213 [Salvia miltiorrhiza]